MITYKAALDRIIKCIKSCETIEQLRNTHIWAHTVMNNRYQGVIRKNANKLDGREKIQYSLGENEGIMVTLLTLITQRIEELNLDVEYNDDFIKRNI